MAAHEFFTSAYAELHPLIKELGALPNRWDDAPADVLADLRGVLQHLIARSESPRHIHQVPPTALGASGIAHFLAAEDARLQQVALHVFRNTLGAHESQNRADLACVLFYESMATDVSRAARRGSPHPDAEAHPNALDASPQTVATALPIFAAAIGHASNASGLVGRFDTASQTKLAAAKYAVVEDTLDSARHLLSQREANVLEALADQVQQRTRLTRSPTISWLLALSDLELFESELWSRHEWAAPLRESGTIPKNATLDPSLAAELDRTVNDLTDLKVLDRLEEHALDAITDPAVNSTGSADIAYAEQAHVLLREVAAQDVVAVHTPSRSALVHLNRDIDIALAELSLADETADRGERARVISETFRACRQRLESSAGRERAAREGARRVGGKVRDICEIDYLNLLGCMAQHLFGEAAQVEGKRYVRFLSTQAAEEAVTTLEQALETHELSQVGTSVRLPRPSAFGLRIQRTRSCRCERHQDLLATAGKETGTTWPFRQRVQAHLAAQDHLSRMARRCATCGSPIALERDGTYCQDTCVRDPRAPQPAFLGRSRRSRITMFLSGAQSRCVPGALFEEVDPLEVLDEDGWVCHLCRQPIPRDVDRFDPMAATVDHLIPLARGGDHVRSNMRAAHRRCNTAKNDQLI